MNHGSATADTDTDTLKIWNAYNNSLSGCA